MAHGPLVLFFVGYCEGAIVPCYRLFLSFLLSLHRKDLTQVVVFPA